MGMFFGLLLLAVAQASPVVRLEAGPDLESRLREALARAVPGATFVLPEGRWEFQDEITLDRPGLTLKGQGPSKTVLSFKNQFTGAQGVLASAQSVTIEDLAVEDTPGDAIKVAGVNGATFRRVRVEWTRGPSGENGPYGFYPVLSRNILIEDCEVAGASDSGVYVGQSENIIVRRVRAHGNVAGIEIENSRYADVYDNDVTGNTAGILVFDLPDLPRQGGRQTRVFDNHVYDNDEKNFSVKGNILNLVPPGVGIMVMANDDVEIFGNRIEGHRLVGIGIVNFALSERPVTDPNYDPRPEKIYIHDNQVKKPHRFSFFDGTRMNFILNLLFGFDMPEVVYDGIEDGTYEGQPLAPDRRICVKGSTFGNAHLDHQRKGVPWPGGPITRDAAAHDCEHPSLPAVTLESPLPLPPPDFELPDEVVARICAAPGHGVNWAATLVDCPTLQGYRLFKDAREPRANPVDTGVAYDVTTPLFSDYAEKHRFVFVPPAFAARYRETGPLDFPVGTVLAKTFSFGDDVVETRLLIHRPGGWVALPYLWNADRTEARLTLGGATRLVKGKQRYQVPGEAKCAYCHGKTTGLEPIGVKAKFLNKGDQLVEWSRLGILTGAPSDPRLMPHVPAWDDPEHGTLTQRAKGYLDINCAHCHSPNGRARNSGLFLESERDENSTAYGRCKPPVAAGMGSGGKLYDFVPGKPKDSILVFRMSSQHLAIRMPEIGRTLTHLEGVKLVKRWISRMQTAKCP